MTSTNFAPWSRSSRTRGDGRRVGAPMAEVIADVLQRPAFAEQSCGTGMAQRVRSMMPSPGTGGQQRGTGDVPQPGARDRPVRGERGEKDLSPPHLRADARDVAQQRPTDLLRQRVPLDVV